MVQESDQKINILITSALYFRGLEKEGCIVNKLDRECKAIIR